MLLRNAFLVWLAKNKTKQNKNKQKTKNKQTTSPSSLSLVGQYCSLCWRRHILITHFMETTIGVAENSEKIHQLNIIDNFLVSKYWGTKAVFHTIYFCTRRFFYWSFKIKAVSCNNIQTVLGKTFMSKRGLFLVFICTDDDVYSLYWFISISKFKEQSTWINFFFFLKF